MSPTWRNYLLIGAFAAVVAGLLGWRHLGTQDLRAKVAAQRWQQAEKQRLQRDHQRLEQTAVPPAEVERRTRERTALAALAGEVAAIRRRSRTPTPSVSPSTTSPVGPESQPPLPDMTTAAVSAAQWRDLGQTTPAAAFETALWAAAGGDTTALARVLAVDDATRTKATELLARLPAPLRQEFSSPEQLVALLTASSVPLGTAQIYGISNDRANEAQLAAQLTTPEGKAKEILFTLHTATDAGRWQLVVPPTALDRYTALLANVR